MLRQTLLLLGLVTAGCVLGDGVDLPSTHMGPGADGGIDAGSGAKGSDGLVEGPPIDGSPSASGGQPPCCTPIHLGGLGGAADGGAGGSPAVP